jgi:hypothetical protein
MGAGRDNSGPAARHLVDMNVMHGLRPSRIARAGSKAAVLHLTFAAQAAIVLPVIGRGADPAP